MQKKPASKDWHRADIIAAVRKTGTSIQRISRLMGLCRSALGNALAFPAPSYERVIANHLGLTPQDIWPSRYHADGSSKSGRNERGIGRYKRKTTGQTKAGRKPWKQNSSTVTKPCNVNVDA
jgi:Ner family transcriptional regulator